MRTRLAAVLGFILLAAPAFARSALVLYDGEKERSDAFLSARFTYSLLGHFALEAVRLESFYDCQPEQAGAADFLFAICEDGRTSLPSELLQAISRRQGPIVWINLQLDELLKEAPGRFPLRFGKEVSGRNWKVSYADRLFAKSDAALQVLLPGGGEDGCRVLAWAGDDDGRRLPYAVQGSNLWVFADSPFAYAREGGLWLIFSDLLHEILGQRHTESRHALLRIEDVNPQSDPASIKAIASYLAGEDVPFQISLIPIYRDPAAQEETYLSDNPELVAALRFAVSRGGAIVMHGISHQYRGASADDYEFWDVIAGTPIAASSQEWLERKLNSGIKECCRNGLYPIAWETPHYAASQHDYRIIGSFFNTFFDRPMVADISDSQMLAPYPYRLPDLGVQVVPENLGYIDLKSRPRDMSLMVRNLDNMGAVHDALASFFFHPFLPLGDLRVIVKAVKARGWKFLSLREFRCQVRDDGRWITTTGGDGSIVLLNQYLHEITFDRKGEVKWEKYSPDRLSGTTYRHVELAPGELHVVEAIDLLPASKQGGWWRKFRTWLGGLFRRQKSRPLILSRALILSSRLKTEAHRNDQRSFISLLNIFGFNPQIRELGSQREFSLAGFDLLVVPQAAANELMAVEMNSVLDFVETGGILITDGRSELAEKMNIRFMSQALFVTQVRDLSLPLPAYSWNPPAVISPFRFDDAQVLCLDNASGQPLAIVKVLGRGQVLFIGTMLDPYTPFGISRYPYFPFYLKNVLGLPFPVRRSNLEFYFDPGLRQNVSWERLVRRWRASGVKIIYLAAWHFYSQYRFDYDYFIRMCHDFGIAVYAWFEFPQVTPLFWDTYPQWREKTAAGLDARVGWRLAMNLFNPEARRQAKEFFWRILTEHDWDGINLAELNYDTNRGLENPDQFVPLNSDVRQEFLRRIGIDPQDFFNPSSPFYFKNDRRNFDRFLRFRCEMVRELHDFFLGEAAKIMTAKKKDMEVIVTALDSLLNPNIIEECGIDSKDIIALMAIHRFTLQVEDPAPSWLDPPDRYLAYLKSYQSRVADPAQLMFDINVTPRPGSETRHLPSPQPIGSELATAFYYAARASGRVGLYAEATVNPFDMDILPFVMGSDVSIKPHGDGFRIDSLQPFTLVLNDSGPVPALDGQAWPFYEKNHVFLPSGRRLLTFTKAGLLKKRGLTPRLNFGGDIYDLSVSGNVYSLRYDSPTPVPLTFSRPLERIRLDGRTLAVPPNKSNLVLARGRHRLEIYTQSQSGYTIEVVGFFSSTVFLVLGLSSLSLLLFLYFYSRRKR
jgi:hypothetical protein